MNTFFIIVNTNNGDTMKENIEFLNYIYKTSKLSLIELQEIKQNIQDKEILSIIKKYEEKYFIICTKATEQLLALKKEPDYISAISRIATSIESRISTMNDQSNTNIAKTIITSNNQTMINLKKHINNYHGKSTKVLKLSNELLRTINCSLNSLKKYL